MHQMCSRAQLVGDIICNALRLVERAGQGVVFKDVLPCLEQQLEDLVLDPCPLSPELEVLSTQAVLFLLLFLALTLANQRQQLLLERLLGGREVKHLYFRLDLWANEGVLQTCQHQKAEVRVVLNLAIAKLDVCCTGHRREFFVEESQEVGGAL